MTNYEHMTDDEKKRAILYGFHLEKGGIIKPCKCECFISCPETHKCRAHATPDEVSKWLYEEYVGHETANEKFCRTLKNGEVIVVWDDDIQPRVRAFHSYDRETDSIRCIRDGILKYTSNYGCMPYEHGRKLNAEDRGD